MSADYSVISYSFHRSFEAGAMDIFSYISFCKREGFTVLDPWMEHLEPGLEDPAWLRSVIAAAKDADLPFGCVAVDGGHIYEPTAGGRAETRKVRESWLRVAEQLEAKMIRVDAGGPEAMPAEAFDIIVDGYNEFIPTASSRGLTVVMENHWGPTIHPQNVVRLIKAIEGLGLLFDTGNWAEGEAERGWELCAPYASLTHFKTRSFDATGEDPAAGLPRAIRLLRDSDYSGTWGIESTPDDGDEVGAARKTLAIVKRELGLDA